jgi:2-oxoglutarate ferredoxin oxidoreductase subunit alpha
MVLRRQIQLEGGDPWWSETWRKDVDGDGIPYRTLPGTHPTKGSYFTRGSSHDEYARYSEDSATYVRVVDRIEKKFETAKSIIHKPQKYQRENISDLGIIFFGTSTYAALEAKDNLKEEGVDLDALRIRSFPFNDDVKRFIEEHDQVFVIEQNKQGQMRSLLITELEIDPKKLTKVCNYDGMPLTADFIGKMINQHLLITTEK